MGQATAKAGVYSFLNVSAAISGPGGSFILSNAGVSDGGIRIVMAGDKNRMTTGAAGDGMHSLIASNAARVTVSLLKTLPGNAQLNALYRFQKTSAAYWGNNIITITNAVSGDNSVANALAFSKHPDIVYASEGGVLEWVFDSTNLDAILGNFYQNAGAAA